MLLKPLLLFGELAVIPAVQHVVGLGLGVLLFVLLRRFGVGPNLAALGAAPVLLDGYQLIIEQYVLTEAFFEALIVGALGLLVWRERPSPAVVGIAGLLLALAGLTRFVGVALIAPALLYVLVRRLGWSRLGALVLGFALPLLAYSLWFNSASGTLGITDRNGFFLYGRVVSFADCRGVDIPASERGLCGEQAPPDRFAPTGIFAVDVPPRYERAPNGNALLFDFSTRMIVARPVEYGSAVGADLLRYFSATPPPRQEPNVAQWRFPRTIADADPRPLIRKLRGSPPPELGLDQEFRIDPGLGAALRSYQDAVYTYGPLLGLLLVLGLLGALFGRERGERRGRAEALLFACSALVLMLVPVLLAVYHFRYVLPVLPLAGPAGALGLSALWTRVGAGRRGRG